MPVAQKGPQTGGMDQAKLRADPDGVYHWKLGIHPADTRTLIEQIACCAALFSRFFLAIVRPSGNLQSSFACHSWDRRQRAQAKAQADELASQNLDGLRRTERALVTQPF